ncbi:MAG: HIT family protein [Patescibacteria group bacterium]
MSSNHQPGCGHCPGGFGLASPLVEEERFWVVCDRNPLTEGHILVIPREHISCVGNLVDDDFLQLKNWYQKISQFISNNYGPVAVFEHGIAGQTVPHCHVHFLPFNGNVADIISQADKLKEVSSLDELRREFVNKGEYLFLEVGGKQYLVDTIIGYPRFFRELFAAALGAPERANWRVARQDPDINSKMDNEIKTLENKWNEI